MQSLSPDSETNPQYKTLVSLEVQSSPRGGRFFSLAFGILMPAKKLCLEWNIKEKERKHRKQSRSAKRKATHTRLTPRYAPATIRNSKIKPRPHSACKPCQTLSEALVNFPLTACRKLVYSSHQPNSLAAAHTKTPKTL